MMAKVMEGRGTLRLSITGMILGKTNPKRRPINPNTAVRTMAG
jgi:hypothetical protein